ncbi:MAG TPA: hypothetical protein VGN57_17920 [Pirellulaceae bacterium]|jgi:hypothetical protein|nr:hypothetical protein [Pirellulaceae bacterium]
MTVVKFSILTLLAGGFCTLLGIGMWMGPQDTPCSAQTGTTNVAAAHSPAPCKSCWSAPSDTPTHLDIVVTEVKRCDADGDGSACTGSVGKGHVSKGDSCERGACDLVATSAPANPWPSAPVASVPRIPAASYGSCSPYGVSDSGVCTSPGFAVPSGSYYPSSAPCPPSSYAPAPVYHVAPCSGPERSPAGYASPYGAVPATVYAAPVASPYATYREVEPRTSDQPSMEMIEAFMEEREKRYEAQMETFETVMELKLQAQAAMLKAEHEVAMAKLHAEAYVKLAGMEQALREEKALLQLVADGTLPTGSLRAILAKNHANGHGSSVQHVSTAAECACEKCACESCKCGQPGASCACAECKCEGCACPGCEQAISTAAPACSACKTSACKTSACKTKACETSACKTSTWATSACGKSGDCKSCEATTVVSAAACDGCTKECDGCTTAPNSLELIASHGEGKGCRIVADGVPVAILNDGCTLTAQGLECIGVSQGREGVCKILFGQKAAACAKDECKGNCKAVDCTTGKCGPCDKSVEEATTASPFVCEKDGCAVEFRFDDVPVLSNIPYVGRLFHNVRRFEETREETAPVAEPQR